MDCVPFKYLLPEEYNQLPKLEWDGKLSYFAPLSCTVTYIMFITMNLNSSLAQVTLLNQMISANRPIRDFIISQRKLKNMASILQARTKGMVIITLFR